MKNNLVVMLNTIESESDGIKDQAVNANHIRSEFIKIVNDEDTLLNCTPYVILAVVVLGIVGFLYTFSCNLPS